MARPEAGRVTKRSSARLRSRAITGTVDLAEIMVNENGGVDIADPANNNLQTREQSNKGLARQPASTAMTQDTEAMLIDSQEHSDTHSEARDKGKGRAMDVTEERLFPFMELPTELRLEVYRACLTRPYKIMLSKAMEARPEPTGAEGEDGTDDDIDMSQAFERDPFDNMSILHRARAQRGLPPLRPNYLLLNRTVRAGEQPRPLSHLMRPTAPRRRQSHTIRFSSAPTQPSLPTASSSNASITGSNNLQQQTIARTGTARQSRRPQKPAPSSRTNTPSADPLIVNILRTNKAVYKEARSLLYSENRFDLSIDTAVPSLAALHQRSRRLIRHVELEIPSYTEIQDKFSEVVRLSLRYCSGLRKLVIHTPFCLPGGDGTTPNSNTQIWAQGFDILRWLPQQCEVVLMGHKNVEIEEVVNKHLLLARTLSPVAYAHRQLIPSDSGASSHAMN